MGKGKGEDNVRSPLSAGGPLCWLDWSGGRGWRVIGGIHVRIAIDYCHCLIPGEGGRRRHARHQRLGGCECEHSCASSAQGQQRPL
jgi:hypothetical protein